MHSNYFDAELNSGTKEPIPAEVADKKIEAETRNWVWTSTRSMSHLSCDYIWFLINNTLDYHKQIPVQEWFGKVIVFQTIDLPRQLRKEWKAQDARALHGLAQLQRCVG